MFVIKKFFGFSLLLSITTLFASTQILDKVVAVVNDSVITSNELNKELSQVKQQLSAEHKPIPDNSKLKKQVLMHLINVKLELDMAKQNHIQVDDVELNAAIHKIVKDNHLDEEKLKSIINEQGLSWKAYRDNIRREMVLARVQQGAVVHNIQVSDEQIDNFLKNHPVPNTENPETFLYHVQNIVVALPEEPTSRDITNALQKANALIESIHKGADFTKLAITDSSGRFALSGGDLGSLHLAEIPTPYVNKLKQMKAGDISQPIRTGNGYHILKLVEVKGKTVHHVLIKTHVQHILIKPEPGQTDEEAKAKAMHIVNLLKEGKPFSMLAKQYSVDATSAVKGGDLGWVTTGELVPTFESAMNQLSVNQVSQPVKSPFGWHVIQVLARKTEDDTKAYQRNQVRAFLQQRKFSEAVEMWQQRLRTDAYVKIIDESLA
jgi:peptidyl-prolyl cis-trans isomerase SurA